jgi:hypothetical protein
MAVVRGLEIISDKFIVGRFFICRTRDNVEGIATGRPRGRSSSPGKVKNFLHIVQTGSGVLSNGYRGLFPRG